MIFADLITPIRTDVAGFANWTDTNVAGTSYLQLLTATSSTITPEMNFDNYNGETLNFKARTYGGTSGESNVITISISSDNGSTWSVIGTRIPATNILTSMNPFDLSSYNETQIKIKFETLSAGSGKGVGIDDIAIEGNPAGVASAPVISNITSITTPPLANEDSNISATVTDADGQDNINQVKIAYTINGGATQYVIINNSVGEPTVYTGNIPASAYNDGDLVEYWIIATDSDDPVHTTESAHYKFFAGISPISTIRALDANNYPVYNNIVCRISGIALNNDGTFNPTTYNDAFIQDATGGLDAFKSPNLTDFNFSEGHSYTVIGTITQYNGKFEIVLTSATDNGFVGLPNIMIVTISQLLANPEYYEGRYIGVMNVNTLPGNWPTTNVNATLTVNDGSSDGTLYINRNTGCYLENEPAWPKDIKGIFSQYDNSSPYTEGYQILVRSINDFVNAGTLPVTFSAFDAALTASNTVSLQWTTQTESNVYGYYIYRNTSNTTTNAERVSALIPATNTSSEHSYEYQDVEIESNQTYYYWITSYELNGHTEWYGPKSVTTNNPNIVPTLPTTTTLVKTYPNPFNTNQTQSIEVKVRDTETATLSIYNIKGQNVKTYSNLTPGTHNLTWNAKDNQNNNCASGIYFYKLTSPTTTVMKKVMIVK
jgi:hypothetical protein